MREHATLNEMMKMSALFYANTLKWIFLVLGHWNNSPMVDMALSLDAFSRFRANHSYS
jgi:hypothetical protein